MFNQSYKSNLTLGGVSRVAVTIGIMFTLGLLYLSQSNAISIKGYTITDLEQRQQELQDEKERLEIEAARLQSINEIQKPQSQAKQSMIPVQNIKFLPTSSVAIK